MKKYILILLTFSFTLSLNAEDINSQKTYACVSEENILKIEKLIKSNKNEEAKYLIQELVHNLDCIYINELEIEKSYINENEDSFLIKKNDIYYQTPKSWYNENI